MVFFKWANPGLFLFTFVLFTFQFEWQIYNLNNIKWKSVDGVLGTQTRDGKMEGADVSTELWRHPTKSKCLSNCKVLSLGSLNYKKSKSLRSVQTGCIKRSGIGCFVCCLLKTCVELENILSTAIHFSLKMNWLFFLSDFRCFLFNFVSSVRLRENNKHSLLGYSCYFKQPKCYCH